MGRPIGGSAPIRFAAFGGALMATIPGTFGPDNLVGTADDDVFYSQTGDDTIFAGAGNDTIWAALGNGVINLGTGADTAKLSDGNQYVSAADDTGPGALGDIIVTGAGSDTILAGGGDNYINVGNGDDLVSWVDGAGGTILAGGGTDTLDLSRATTGREIYGEAGGIAGSNVYFNGFESIVATNLNDTVWGAPATIDGAGGNDVIYGGAGTTLMVGGTGDDLLISNSAAATILGGSGADTIFGAGSDSIDGGDGNNVIRGSDFASTLIGGVDADTIIGGTGAETIDGGSGSNYLNGGAGANVFKVGLGNDVVAASGTSNTLDFSNAASGASIFSYGGATGSGFSVGFNPGAVNHYIGSSSADTFVNFYSGLLEGGAGLDTLDNSGAATAQTVDLTQPVSPAFALNLVSIEGVKTGIGNDTIIGNDDGNQLDAGAGNDQITGGAGDDTIIGGIGNDDLAGGEGANTFVFAGSFGTDTISDFKVGVDKLAFSGITSTQVTFTADGEVSFGTNNITILADGDLSISDFIFS
ncbi:calcium-binding protein [Belnapia sp. F-4-1]|uniref:calcium-binding protein n=1 Tax=Belnapia sp. F-4-1 TaxID=1545443 RepID=UPI0009E00D4F